MSRWLEMFREARTKADTPVTIETIGDVSSARELLSPIVTIVTDIESETEAAAQWDAADWRALHDERGAILQYDGKLDRAEAERQAFEATITHWLNAHPPEGLDPDICAACGHPVGEIGTDAVPFLTGGGEHVWLHHGCHGPWMAKRRAEAKKALMAMGV